MQRAELAAAVRFGDDVVFAGTTTLHRKAKAEEIAAERGLTMVPPFDHEWIIAGQGTLQQASGDLNFAHVRAFVDRLVTVEEDEIAAAVRWLFTEVKFVAEPSGAVTVAAALRDDYASPVVAVISGGNIDPSLLQKFLS